MIIRDELGHKLYLSKTRLSESEKDGWFLKLAEFPKLTAKQYYPFDVTIYVKKATTNRMVVAVGVSAWAEWPKIGCHYFSRKTFRLIQQAAKAARKVVQ